MKLYIQIFETFAEGTCKQKGDNICSRNISVKRIWRDRLQTVKMRKEFICIYAYIYTYKYTKNILFNHTILYFN